MMDGTTLIMYAILVVVAISALLIRRDTKDLIKRSDAIQKSLNSYIKKEQHR